MQSTRSSTVSNVQSNYSGGCHNCSSNWDSGDAAAGFVAGAIVAGTVVAAASTPPPTTVVATAPPPTTTVVVAAPTPAPPPAPVAPPCNVAPIPVSGVPYYQCGTTWYTAAYASSGVIYMPVPPPPGY
jgi:hypothetical protein